MKASLTLVQGEGEGPDRPEGEALLEELKAFEAHIGKSEATAISWRWESGRRLLIERAGKKLPNGRLDELAAALGASRRELQRRMQFAEAFRTEGEVASALTQWGSWDRIINEAMVKPSKAKTTVVNLTPELIESGAASVILRLEDATEALAEVEPDDRGLAEIDRALAAFVAALKAARGAKAPRQVLDIVPRLGSR